MSSLFRDVPRPLAQAAMQPFKEMMVTQMRVNGQLVNINDPEVLAQQLSQGEVQLGVFHGFEFAGARLKHPELQPLMIAVNYHRHLHSYLIVGRDMEVTAIEDLNKKTLALPRRAREHSRLFLQRLGQGNGQEPKQLFAQTVTPANSEEALDNIVDGVAQATVVDGVALESYKHLKPGRFAKLKVARQSPTFPAAVIAYRPGAVDEQLILRFREGMLHASDLPVGRQLMIMWNLTSIEPVPPDYEQTLADIAKAYPPPVVAVTTKEQPPVTGRTGGIE